MRPEESFPENRSQQLIEWLRNYARTRLNSTLSDERRCLPPSVVLDLGRMGFLGLTGPTELGGAGLPLGESLRVLRHLSTIDLALGNMVGMHNFLGSKVLLSLGTDAVRNQFERDLISGRQLAAFALTEDVAGSDPRRIRTTAVQKPEGGWILTGRKVWAGLAAWSGIAVVFAQATDTEGNSRGITAFAVPLDLPGVIQGPESVTMGLRAIPQNELRFEQVTIPPEYILGSIGGGLGAAQSGMMMGRLVMTVFANAAMLRCIQVLRRYVFRRTIGTGRMADNPIVQDMAAREIARTHAVSLFLESCFKTLDAGRELSQLVCLASKIVGPDQAWLTVDTSMQLLGGRGYIEPNVVARMARDLRIIRVFEGPTEALTAHLGGLVSARPNTLEELLGAELGASDVWAPVIQWIVYASPLNPENRALSRSELLRLQYNAGRIAANAIFLSVVRREATSHPGDALALRIAEEHFESIMAEAVQPEPWCDMNIANQLGADLDAIVGDVDETKSGEDWGRDPLLSNGFCDALRSACFMRDSPTS